MLLFLTGVIEQLDLALEHIRQKDVHNARFGLMLTDNALELLLHQIVKDKRSEAASWRYRDSPYPYETQLRKAYLGSFSEKVAFARLEGGLDARSARTFDILHAYRNDLYHAGLAHEGILLCLAQLYFDTVCTYLACYEPLNFWWSSSQTVPQRAQKYFTLEGGFPGKREDFEGALKTLAAGNDFAPEEVSEALADDLDQIIEQMDACLQIVADGVFEGQQISRDEAVLSTQAWDLAFSEEGREFVAKLGFEGSPFAIVEFLTDKYRFPFRRDPIPSWQQQSKRLRSQCDPHLALDHYQSFVLQTGPLRLALEQSAGAAEAAIDQAIDQIRGK